MVRIIILEASRRFINSSIKIQEYRENQLFINEMVLEEIHIFSKINSSHSGGFYNVKPNYSSIHYFNNNLRKYKDFPISRRRRIHSKLSNSQYSPQKIDLNSTELLEKSVLNQ